MKRRKALSLLLILTLLLSPALPAATAYAAEGSSGMEISKTATANEDGSYTVTLEAYATGAQVITNVTTEVPTDIVLVLDQSGSMANPIGSVSFDAYTGSNAANESLYSHRHNGGDNNLWHRLEDGSHVSVSVAKQEVLGYTAITNQSNSYYFINQNNLYARVNGAYQKVTVTFDNLTFTYTLSDGTQIASTPLLQLPTFTGIDGGVLYLAAVDNTATIYTYTYTDLGGNVQTIGTSTGENTRFTEPPLYQRTTNATGGGSRLNALRTAATYFINAVAEKAAGADGNIETTADNINHRIAVVGFASASGYGNNTELLSISGSNSGNVGVAYNDDITNQHYIDVVQNMDTAAGQTMVHNAINALAASGATRVDLGMTMAKNILDNNPVSANEQRNRVVIVFTDGSPTSSDNFDKSVANAAILASNNIKNSGATVYSIGVFSGADATSAGAEPSGNLNSGSAQFTAACNWFMQQISSSNGTPQTPSYYLSAADADALNNIFQQISDQIETGGTSSTLTSEAVVKDIISPQFTLPAGADASSITLETYACTGMDAAGEYTWVNNNSTMGAAASIEGDQVSVTGFNFSENYVGTVTTDGSTTYRGHKLVIRFNVWPKAGFLGGNDVFTNASAGIYANSTAEEPLLTFDRPTVNAPIKDVTVEAQDKNVYLMGAVTAEALKADTGINVGNVSLDLTQENYGLEPWQTEYVNIEVAVRDAGGTTVSDTLENLDEDTTYTVEVTVTPKTDGEQSAGDKATEKIGNDTANINVFCPELTFKDSTAYYGETVPTGFSGNPVGTKWKHGGTEDDSVVMLGDKPMPEFTYTPDESKLGDGKFTKQEVPVAVMVRINQEDVTAYTTFVHRDCDPACGWQDPASKYKAFLIHIKTCTLKITKQGGAADEPYVFDVYKDGVKYSEVTVWGNGTETLYELPVGNYTIVENEGWSWRYTADNGGSAVLSANNASGSITCENEKKDDLWLNGFSAVVRNIFGMSH